MKMDKTFKNFKNDTEKINDEFRTKSKIKTKTKQQAK